MSENLQRLPLNALQAFASVAHLGSVRAAAENLFVTHGAVSQQIKKLEAHLDQNLVERQGRGIKLTAAGKQLAAQVTPLLQQLSTVTQEIDPKTESGVLSVACSQDILLWLLYQLQDFNLRYPNITLEFREINKGATKLPDVEVAILDVLPSNSGYGYTVLTQLHLFPVGLTALFKDKVEQSHTWPLIHDDNDEEWNNWFKQAGQHKSKGINKRATRQLYLPNASAVIVACKEGLGVALTYQQEVEDELKAGTLMRLSQQEAEIEIPHFLVTCEDKVSHKANLFSEWFKEICQKKL